MKFLFENNTYDILIAKYKKSDLIITSRGVWIIGTDECSKNLRVPKLNSKKAFIHPSQIAEFDEYLYIPVDQIPKDDYIYKFSKPQSKKLMLKSRWKEIKTNHPYIGEK